MNNNKDELLSEYHFDYSKAKPNRFATQQLPATVTLDADVANIFTNSESVNNALRAILSAFPNPQHLHEIK
jgi:hypothetical protein